MALRRWRRRMSTREKIDEPRLEPAHKPDHEPLPEGEEAPPPGVRTMAVVRWLLVGLMAVAAAGSVAHYVGWIGVASARAGVKYHCPMHPGIIQDQPGECPICGMTLV